MAPSIACPWTARATWPSTAANCPTTGDPDVDLQKSRHMRFFQSRDIPHMGRFKLQSYIRDTGEVMFNLSVPIEPDGRYWGGLFIGLPASVLGIE